MTREKALEWFKDRKELYLLDDKCQQAEDMAIKALEQEPIDKSAMMSEIYMEGVNMTGEYQGCWVRFRDIEKIVNKYMTESEEKQIDDEIRVGDEIENDIRGKAIVLYKEPYGLWHCIYSLGAFSLLKEHQSLWHKTGRHFDQIEEVLKRMQEDEG